GAKGGRAQILVCDDEQQILRALRVILRDSGYEALPASTGEEALDVAAVSHPAAGILDLVLPTSTASSSAAACASGPPCRSSCSRRWARRTPRSGRWPPAPTTTSPSPSGR